MKIRNSPEASCTATSARIEAAWEAVEGAIITIRSADEDGIRCVIHSPFLGGAWIHSDEETLHRIQRYHPNISADLGTELLRIIRSRIQSRVRLMNQQSQKKVNWVNSWRQD